MDILVLQEKIDSLLNSVHKLLPVGGGIGYVYVDDLVRLNKEIHDQINDLYPLHGKTTEQEAALCLAVLTGYSVSIYANPADEIKRLNVLKRSRNVLSKLSSTSLKEGLLAICKVQ